jgi:hypothetical protein
MSPPRRVPGGAENERLCNVTQALVSQRGIEHYKKTVLTRFSYSVLFHVGLLLPLLYSPLVFGSVE